jgi:hypothetical protein
MGRLYLRNLLLQMAQNDRFDVRRSERIEGDGSAPWSRAVIMATTEEPRSGCARRGTRPRRCSGRFRRAHGTCRDRGNEDPGHGAA